MQFAVNLNWYMHGLNLKSLKSVNSLKICVLFNSGWKYFFMLKGFFRVPQEFEYNHCKDYFSMKQAHDLLFKGMSKEQKIIELNRFLRV